MKRIALFTAVLLTPVVAFAATAGEGCSPLCAALCFFSGGCGC